VNVEFDLLLHVPTRSVKSWACACITAPASSSTALNDTILALFSRRSNECGRGGYARARCAGRVSWVLTMSSVGVIAFLDLECSRKGGGK
jgi:hypothetical protein